MTIGVPPIALGEWVWRWPKPQSSSRDLESFAPQQAARTKIRAFEAFYGRLEGSPPRDQWAALLALATIDVGTARTLEPHVDALTMLREAGHPGPEADTTWGVYAAEAAGMRLESTAEGTVTGDKPWCSLANELSHAIVTAWVGEQRQAFAIPLSHPSVTVANDPWDSLGLREIPSGPIHCELTPAYAVGGPDWYLQRPGFWWGAIRVAACWLGGSIGLAQQAANKQFSRPQPDPHRNLLLGQLDAQIYAGITALEFAASAAENTPQLTSAETQKLALRVRNHIHRTCQTIQQLSQELAGPKALTADQRFMKADADLTVYLSQHHGVRDEAELGMLLVTDEQT